MVVAAAMICTFACLAAVGFHARGRRARGNLRAAWIGLTGGVSGAGIWATHFMAMLAYQPGLQVAYDPVGTALSLVIAIAGMTAAFSFAVLAPGRAGIVCASALTALGISAMHYTGIAAIRAQAQIHLAPAIVALSIVIVFSLSLLVFMTLQRASSTRQFLMASGLLILAICGLHFTAMGAIDLIPDPAMDISPESVGRGTLAFATGGIALLVLSAAGALIGMERLGQRSVLANLKMALDATPAGMAFFDPEDRLIAFNEAYGRITAESGIVARVGMAQSRLVTAAVKAGWFDFAPDGGVSVIHKVKTRNAVSSEFQLPGGRWLSAEAFPTRDGGSIAVLTDITAQKEVARVLAEARDSAEAANRAKSEFLANMSHEIRTPLNGMLGAAEVLRRTELSAKQSQMVGVLQTSGDLLNALLTDVLDLARVEAGVVTLRPEPTDMCRLIWSVHDIFCGRAEEKGLALRVEMTPGAEALVDCDPLRLRQVVGNLVGNAVKFTEAGEVVIAVERHGDDLRFEVRDTGAGFDDAKKAALFKRFQQADNTATRKHGGAGLGLAICQEYVALMGGELDCASRPGVGSSFTFTVSMPVIAVAEAPVAVAESEPAMEGFFRVLVVDDNATNRQVMA